MQYFRSERRKKNERFRFSIRLNEGLPFFGREKQSKVSFLFSQTDLDVDFLDNSKMLKSHFRKN